MKQPIRHRRLHAFYNSKVLNAMMIIVIISLMQIHTMSITIPVICASTALALFIGYTIWLWGRKPAKIVINRWLSELNSLYTLYFLIVAAIKSDNHLWYTFPAITAIPLFFAILTGNHDKTFDIISDDKLKKLPSSHCSSDTDTQPNQLCP